MTDDELALFEMQEERDEFEKEVFEVLFGIDARPCQTVDEYYSCNTLPCQHRSLGSVDAPRVFSYQEAHEALAGVSKSLQLLHTIKEHFSCPQEEEEDTEENMEMRELIDRLEGDLR